MSIKQFFSGQHLFITGGTGFMGKVLIEKLLRSCPDIETIYVLVRIRKGVDIYTRVQNVFEDPLFDTIKKQQPDVLKTKVVPVHGDIRELRLGLSEEDYNTLIKKVSVIFHVAATVRFDEPLKDAIIMNVRGTYELVQIAKKMENIKVLLHVSTTYCNCTLKSVEEKIYDSPIHWREAIALVENIDKKLADILTKKFLGMFPNTYVFSKLLAENIINDERYNLPMVILRPSVVMSMYNDPEIGWIDNYNGPVGLMVACVSGILRVILTKADERAQAVPVDEAIKCFIVAAWHRATHSFKDDEILPVYQCVTIYCRADELINGGLKVMENMPIDNAIWRPSVIYTTCLNYFYILTMLLHIFPAIMIDFFVKLTGKKIQFNSLLHLQRRIYLTITALSLFMTRTWDFKTTNFNNLKKSIPPSEYDCFVYNDNFSFDSYSDIVVYGMQKYLLKLDLRKIPENKKRMKKLIILDYAVKTLIWVFILWIFIRLYNYL